MTEAEWLASNDPKPMLEFLRGKASDRKLRLFAVSSFRRDPTLHGEEWEQAVEIAERYADGQTEGREVAPYRVFPTAWDDSLTDRLLIGQDAYFAAWSAFSRATKLRRTIFPERLYGRVQELPVQVALLRDIFGNPFRILVIDPRWRTSTVLGLAHAIYAERAFDRLPILADALEDAGCDQPDLLAHCRSDGPHVRGCWAVDLILGIS